MPRGRKLRPENKHLMQRLVDILQLYDGSDDGLFLPMKVARRRRPSWDPRTGHESPAIVLTYT